MSNRPFLLQRITLGLLLAACGLYAGVLLMYSVGISPTLDSFDPETFLRFWQTHDYFLHLRIRFVYVALAAFYAGALATARHLLRTWVGVLMCLALFFSAAEVGVNRSLQRPVNRSIRLADVGTHSASSIYSMERQLFHALHLRQAASLAAFGLLIAAAMLPTSEEPRRRPR